MRPTKQLDSRSFSGACVADDFCSGRLPNDLVYPSTPWLLSSIIVQLWKRLVESVKKSEFWVGLKFSTEFRWWLFVFTAVGVLENGPK